MKKWIVIFSLSIPYFNSADAQTLQWIKNDSSFNSGSGHVLALANNQMFVVANCDGGSFAVLKYDENGNVIFQKNFPGHR